MEPTTILTATLVFLWIVFLWDLYLSWRQYQTFVRTTERPEEIVEIMDKESFDKSRVYKIERMRFDFIHSIYSQLETTVVLLFEIIAYLWVFSGGLLHRLGYEHEILHSIMFVCVVSLIEKVLGLPWTIYDTFVIEERHGFNKQTPGFFIKDQIKKTFVGLLLTIPIVAGLIWVVKIGGDYFFVYAWGFMSLIILIMMTIYPEFIAPLFDKYSPLPEGELRTRIEALAAKLEYPLTKLLVVENSKRSSHSNAYLYGFWKNKRIVLYDTIIGEEPTIVKEMEKNENKQSEDGETVEESEPVTDTKKTDEPPVEPKRRKLGMSNDEVLAVLGHELGHWKLWHVAKMLIISELNILLMMMSYQYLYRWSALYAAFGFHDSQPVLIGISLVFMYVLAPYNEISNLLLTQFVRHNEFGADRFSAELGYGELMISGLIKISKDNLSFPVNDWLYSWANHSHPPVVERVRAIREYKAKSE